MKRHLFLAAPFAAIALTAHAESVCQLDSAGADDTSLIQHSIDTCAAQGGGTLRLAPRTYRIRPVQLKSNVYLWLDHNTVLEGSRDKNLYVAAFIGWPFHPREALISGNSISNAGILGTGVITGNGQAWWEDARRQRKDGTMAKLYPSVPDANGMPRPWLVEFYQSSKIRIEGVTLKDSPMWNLALRYARDVQISNLTISNPAEAPNTDGIDLISSQNVDIHQVNISTGDDNITFKSGLAGFDVPAGATANIRVSDAQLGAGHGVSVGSETLHGINNITLENLRFTGTSNGFRIKTGRDRGADIGFIHIKDVQMTHVGMPLSITAYYPKVPEVRGEALPVSDTTPHIHDIDIENVSAADAKTAGQFIGIPESPLSSIRLHRVSLSAVSGLIVRDASLHTDALKIEANDGPAIKALENAKIIHD